ncbi:hypothetical protein P692DRAFT_20830915 [Suillus brevipes Sb2]|nr:hypothetical protein P692DRAFT_20830915 [Suillus brevipes Sb2]
MEDKRPFAAKPFRGSSESTTIELQDELRCLYAMSHWTHSAQGHSSAAHRTCLAEEKT